MYYKNNVCPCDLILNLEKIYAKWIYGAYNWLISEEQLQYDDRDEKQIFIKKMVIWSLVGKSTIDLSVFQHVPKKAL